MKVDYQWKLIDQIAAPILILDPAGEICYLNDHARELLGFGSEVDNTNISFSQFICQADQRLFDKSFIEVLEGEEVADLNVVLDLDDGKELLVTLGGEVLDEWEGNDQSSIWTITKTAGTLPNGDLEDRQSKLEDMQWLANQGRNLLTHEGWSEILFQASQALQEKLGDCYIISLMMLDDSNLQLEGIFGIDNRLINQVWKMIGKNLHDHIFPIDDRFRDTYCQRSLYKHPGGLEEFALSQVPENVSRKLSKLVGLKDIYTIGLEGKRAVLGCFYIITINDRPPVSAELVESFTFQVALALEKSRYSRDLEISEHRYQTIFEYAPDGCFISDLQGTFLTVNSALENITGFGREELIGRNFLKAGLLSSDQIPFAGKLFTQGVLGKSTDPNDFVFTRKGGSTIPVEISSYPLEIEDKSVILGIARDISQQQESEENLIIAHNTITRVLEGIDAHVYVADIETHEILYMNKRMIEEYGANYEGKLCYKSFNGYKRPCPHCVNSQLLDQHGFAGDVVVWEDQNRRNKRWYRNYDRAISWTDQRLVRLQIAMDITDSKIASTALQQSENRYRSLFESSHNPLMTLSPPDWLFTSGNPAVIEMYGLEDENQFLSLKPWQLSPEFQPDGRLSTEKAREMIQIAVDQGSNFFTWTHKRINGEEFPATVHLTRVDTKDDFFVQATVRDITDIVMAEGKLEQQMQDLTLMNDLNVAANHGMDLQEILNQVSHDTERIFSGRNTTIFLLSEDKTHLQVNLLDLNNSLFTQIENIAGISLPEYLEIPLKEGGLFYGLLGSSEANLLSNQEQIFELLMNF